MSEILFTSFLSSNPYIPKLYSFQDKKMDESTALNVDEQSLIEASNLINNQELRIHQRRLEELRLGSSRNNN